MDEPQEIKPRNKGGRPKGARNKVGRDWQDFLKSVWESPQSRKNLLWLIKGEGPDYIAGYRQEPKLAQLAVALHARTFGKPIQQAPPDDHRSPLLFITQHSVGTYDPLAEKAAALAARKAERALPEKTPEAYEPPKEGDPEALVVVEPGSLAAQALPRKP